MQKFSAHESRVVQRSLIISKDGNLKLYIHGELLPNDHDIYSKIVNVDFYTRTNREIIDEIIHIIGVLRLFEVCTGVTKLKYQGLWKKMQGCVIDNNLFKETRFQQACRSNLCKRIVPQSRRECSSCLNLAKKFARKLQSVSNIPISPSGRIITPNKHKPFSALTTPEKKARSERYMKNIRNLKKQNERLREKVRNLIEEQGVDIDEEVDDYLEDALIDPENEPKIVSASDFHKIFLQQQMEARKKKGRTGHRWHPLMIRFALHLKMVCTNTGYRSLRGFLELPSERRLFDYSHVYEVREGCHNDIIQDVGKEVASMKHGYQKYHSLFFDEIYISQNLVARKSDGKVVGYSHLDEVTEEILRLENSVQAAAEGVPEGPVKPEVAKTILAYMVKGTASKVKNVVAAYSISALTKEDIFTYTWEVVERLETSGIKIVTIVCDGSPINRGFIDMNTPRTTDSNVVFDTVNPYDPSRAIFFISDVPHLLKTIRNCFSNSGMKKSRKLYKNGQYIVWNTIIKLFNLKSKQIIKKLHKLDAAAVFLNRFTCQKTIYAFIVISDSVASVLEQLKWPGTSETCIFEKN